MAIKDRVPIKSFLLLFIISIPFIFIRVQEQYLSRNIGIDGTHIFRARGNIRMIFISATIPCLPHIFHMKSLQVIETIGSGYWCEVCQKNDDQCSLRYILVIKVSDYFGEAWVSIFNDQAEKIIGYTADELDRINKEDEDEKFLLKLKEATWVPYLFRVSIEHTEYMSEKRQRKTVRAQALLGCLAESIYLLEEITKMSIVE